MQMGISVQEQVYQALRAAILELKLEPGTIVSTQELADRLRVSRTPVREALIHLQRDGLVIVLPQRETMISRIDMERVNQERFMRKNLESAVLGDFIHQVDAAQMVQLYALVERQAEVSAQRKCETLLEYDDAFHRLFFEKAGQQLSWNVLELMNTHYQRVRLLNLRRLTSMGEIITQHTKLLQAIESKQTEQARSVLCDHLCQLDSEEADLRTAYPNFFTSAEPEYGILLV